NKVKGFEVSIKAMALLLQKHPHRDILLVLVGEGPEKHRLEKLADELGIRDRVFFPGFSSRPWEAFCGIDIFVMPSLQEGLPIALLEAMACQCLPVATQINGVIEVLKEPDLGWLVQPNDSVAFANAMEASLLMSDEERRKRALKGRRHVVQA